MFPEGFSHWHFSGCFRWHRQSPASCRFPYVVSQGFLSFVSRSDTDRLRSFHLPWPPLVYRLRQHCRHEFRRPDRYQWHNHWHASYPHHALQQSVSCQDPAYFSGCRSDGRCPADADRYSAHPVHTEHRLNGNRSGLPDGFAALLLRTKSLPIDPASDNRDRHCSKSPDDLRFPWGSA